jgi:Ca2+-binding RTX toxin-like protein
MIHKKIPRVVIFVLIVLIVTSIGFAYAANIIVPNTRLSDQSYPIDPNKLKPTECAALNLTAIYYCTGGICNASNADELIFGTSGYDDIRGKNGNDCIIGGGGDDDISGGNGTDVCIGGPGNDLFGKNNDCETEIQ